MGEGFAAIQDVGARIEKIVGSWNGFIAKRRIEVPGRTVELDLGA